MAPEAVHGGEMVFIAVMGVTGAGKSTFIQTASGDSRVTVGHGNKSCTTDIVPWRFKHEGHDITLIDTPGFNDTTRGETEVLKEIAEWLALKYKNDNTRLSGIIYMHALDDRRMYGSTLRNLKMFRQLCGEEPMRNVIFTTTGWGTARKAEQLSKALEKESELCTDGLFWEPMLRRGAQTARFEDSRESALRIIDRLVPRPPVVLQIQHEMVDEQKNLIDTAAGATVNEEIKKLEARYKDEIAKVQQEMQAALVDKDNELHSALEETKNRLEHLREENQRAQELLQYERRNAERRHDNAMQDLRMALESQKLSAQQKEDQMRAEAAAQRYADRMRFDEVVATIRANVEKVRHEDRIAFEAAIARVEAETHHRPQKPQKPGGGGGGGKSDRTKRLLLGLLPTVGSVALAAVGLPLGLNPFSEFIKVIREEFDSDANGDDGAGAGAGAAWGDQGQNMAYPDTSANTYADTNTNTNTCTEYEVEEYDGP
ncbi:hypothetical protein G647_01827 [Cladophialophora carrionii CBS 160.54]|uniref:G domain-containing protein n=1 Tax=Cladophialophora carrionii CBS 160.54 TaxID=1279043 RepID=V9DR75_9EURO|nr:uncharacterized protein G647_01827 [Cladophialophora carrionii CBS 160.54]ETI29374.1 hypothetical protein G647_01827 [Cladophialophora carrionii CBS 160.54]